MNNKFHKVTTIGFIIMLGSGVANAVPIFNSVNGHYYDAVSAPNTSWTSAEAAANAMTHLGVNGHLATITSASENTFLVDSFDLDGLPYWLGGLQNPTTGNWGWVTDEVWFYENWAAGEPNNSGGNEDALALAFFAAEGTWNDAPTGFTGYGNGGYVVEYDTVPPIAYDDPINPAKSGETINIDVLLNDDDRGQEITAVVITTDPDHGTVDVVACTGANPSAFCVDYTSDPVFGGDDEFEYEIYSGDLVSGTATVNIQVDGSVTIVQTGPDAFAFGGVDNGVPLLATGELASNPNNQESSVKCCTVRDPRVGAGNTKKGGPTAFESVPFDIGAALSTPLADGNCAGLPQPLPGELIVERHFGVHTENPDSINPEEYRFGLCVVETGVDWLGPVHLDVTAEGIPGLGTDGDPDNNGYSVDCKLGEGVDKQPLTLGLTTFPPEYVAPYMRATTIECDPRSVAKWSTWWVIPNAQHLTGKETSLTYTSRMSSDLKNLIEAMRFEFAVAETLLNEVKAYVVAAESLFKDRKATGSDYVAALEPLDMATIEALIGDPEGSDYPGSVDPFVAFANPKGELVSHLMALRYAVCSELAYPNNLGACQVDPDVEFYLPPLPVSSP